MFKKRQKRSASSLALAEAEAERCPVSLTPSSSCGPPSFYPLHISQWCSSRRGDEPLSQQQEGCEP